MKPGQGVAFLRVMYVLNYQLAESEETIASMIIELDKVKLCKNNEDYSRLTKKMSWSLQDLSINLKTASGYDQLDFVFWSGNAAEMLPHISKFEGTYSEFITPQE